MSFSFENVKSLGGNLWKTAPVDERKAELISQSCNLPLLVAEILASRGIAPQDVSNFIEPKLQNLLPDPSVMKDMSKAAAKIAEAVISGRKIAIIGDYDVDGATSSSVLRLFLESVGCEPLVHIPEREEGYGPSTAAFDEFAAQGADFVITVDCGTTAFNIFDYAKEKGFEVIVLDHHEAETRLPDVYAVVNPKRLDESDEYPYLKYMAAVGVVFVAIVAVNRELRERGFYQTHPEPSLIQWLDLVALGAVIMVFPLIYMVLSSFMTKNQILSANFSLIPDPWRFGKYSEVLQRPEFLRGLRNTLIVAIPVLVIGGFTSSLAAFSFSKLRVKGKNGIFLGLLATMMIPFAVVMIPQYVMFTKMGWTNSLLPLIIPGLFGNVSMIFFLRQNLSSIPTALVEAAKIDGCGYFKMYYSIFLPLMKGALMTQLILWFMGIWNDYLAPTIFIQNEEWFTLQVVIRSFNSYYAVNSDYPLIMAASVLSILPTLLLFFFFQRYIIESMAISGVKG